MKLSFIIFVISLLGIAILIFAISKRTVDCLKGRYQCSVCRRIAPPGKFFEVISFEIDKGGDKQQFRKVHSELWLLCPRCQNRFSSPREDGALNHIGACYVFKEF